MANGLAGKVAVVTGASRGIGRAIAVRLATEGMAVAIGARDEGKLREVAGEIEQRGGKCLVHGVDLSEPAGMGGGPAGLVAAAVEKFGRIDLIVNNAGATKRGDFLGLTDPDWADGFGLKLFGAVRMCRAAWKHLVQSGGSIINIAGVGGRAGSEDFAIGGSVNAAMLNFTKCLADRGVREGVRVNAINPGYIRTDRLTVRIERMAKERGITLEEAGLAMAKEVKIARFGEPEEIAAMVAFLAGAEAAYCQGMIVDVDGGMTRAL